MPSRLRSILFHACASGAVLFFASFLLAPPTATAATNLIPNPTLESSATAGFPDGWKKGGYGVNTRTLTYPVDGHGGGKATRIDVTAYTSGDAKWYFSPVAVEPLKALTFSDYYRSNATSYVTAEFILSDGTRRYLDLGRLSPTSTWTKFEGTVTPPAGTVRMTVFHLIKSIGFLETDDFFLGASDAGESGGFIENASVEAGMVGGLPVSWQKGGYGTNVRTHTYPVDGYDGSRAIRVEMASYTSGDAKWYFSPVAVEPLKALKFSDYYRSNATSYLTAEIRMDDGSRRYIDLGRLSPSDTWKKFTGYFTPPAGAVSVTVFHLIKSIGFLETDNYTLTRSTSDPTHFSEGHVSLMFDDGYIDAYRNAFPILDRAGFKADTFIVTERLRENDFPGYVKAADVLAMQAKGHEIGAHTRTHANLTLLSLEEAEAEMNGSREDLRAIGAAPVDYFAFPYGAYNTTLKNMLRNAGFLAARSSDGGYNLKTQDTFALRRLPMTNATTFADIKGYIDTARAEKTWAILLFHQVDESGDTYAVTPELFQETVDYLKNIGETPITIREGLARMNE